MTVLYWFHDDTCGDITTSGYVGITKDFKRRKWQHDRTKRFLNCRVKIIFEGTTEECLQKERELRPSPKIGWNTSIGGVLFGKMTGRKHSDETRKRMSEARAKWHNDNPDWKPKSTLGTKHKKSPEFREKLSKIAKSRYRKYNPDGTWTWGYKS